MSIVLNERDWALDMVNRSDIGKKPSETLRRVARMYIDDGFKVDDVRKKLVDFIIRSNPNTNVYSWNDAVSRAIVSAQKYEAICITKISVSKTEMQRVDALEGKQIRRFAFTLLCLAKYWDLVRHTNDHWVNSKDNEIMRMANIGTSIKRQSAMYFTLRELGMIQFSKMVDNTNVKVCFVDNEESVMDITDLRNLGYQYLMYHGEPYFVCDNCGITTKMSSRSNGRHRKYCRDCAVEVAVQQRVNSIMRKRHGIGELYDKKDGDYIVYMHESPNGKRYVGSTTTTLSHRWKQGLGYDKNSRFWGDIVEYGWENIKHYIIAIVESKELAKTIESLYIKKYQTTDEKHGYNRSSGETLIDISGDIEEAYPPKQTDESGALVG